MSDFLKMLGAYIVALVMIAIPILCGLSYALEWSVNAKIFSTFFTFLESVIIAWIIEEVSE